MEFTLLFAALSGVATAWLAVKLLDRSERQLIPDHTFELVLNAAVIGVVVGRLWAMIAAGTNPISHPGDFIVIRGGVDPLGASLGALGALIWTTRREGLTALDAIAPVALWGLAGWHAGCVITGSCLGAASSLPWALTEAGSDIGRHPVEVYAALLLAAGALMLVRLPVLRPGVAAALALLVAGAARLITEPLRLSLGGGRTGLYVIGVVVAGVAAVALARRDAARAIQNGSPPERQ